MNTFFGQKLPILDNQAIFGAYMNPHWPEQLARSDSVKNGEQILRALDLIVHDLNREENRLSWNTLQAIEPERTMIQLFDSVWWMYFRFTQPVSKGELAPHAANTFGQLRELSINFGRGHSGRRGLTTRALGGSDLHSRFENGYNGT